MVRNKEVSWSGLSQSWQERKILVIVVVILIALLLRAFTGIYPHSGYQTPPMYGDFEAQRHWMEITLNLPPQEWYKNSTDNDLMYWGIDYPPLSSYHTYLVGKGIQIFEPESVELHSSRGCESPGLVRSMRLASLITDLVIFFPAVFFFVWVHFSSRHFSEKMLSVALILWNPLLILIDHGHFQYNSVMLGFALVAFSCFLKNSPVWDAWGSMFYILSVSFKQMTLYFAPCIAVLLFYRAFTAPSVSQALQRCIFVGGVIFTTMGLLFFPWLGSWDDLNSVLFRLFPVARGLFEDKVANFWVVVHPILRVKFFPLSWVLQLSSVVTLLSMVPSLVLLWVQNGSSRAFLLSLMITSLSAFLFSFQVHEKTILVPLLPFIVTFSVRAPFFLYWATSMSAFTLWPLLSKDGLSIPFFILLILYCPLAFVQGLGEMKVISKFWRRFYWVLYALSWSGAACVWILELGLRKSPFNILTRFPDLFLYLNCFLGFIFLFTLYIVGHVYYIRLFVSSGMGKIREKDE